MKNLSQVTPGNMVVVRAFHLPEQTALRLEALGMIAGTKVGVLQRKGKGTIILDLRGTRFALGEPITRNIDVEEVSA